MSARDELIDSVSDPVFHSVIIASRRRPEVLSNTLECIWRQNIVPDEVIVSIVEETDLPRLMSEKNMAVFSQPGSCIQRNSGLSKLNNKCNLVSFLDDDLELDPDYFMFIRSFFLQYPTAAGANGNILLEGCGRELAQKTIQNYSKHENISKPLEIKSLYGCNMHFKRSAIANNKFDERLSLYGWLEDFDFSSRVGKNGSLYCIPQAVLCHLKEPTGRMNNRKFGFAQIMNPFYLYKKKLIKMNELIKNHILPCSISNILKIAKGSTVGKDRISGNMKALQLIMEGKCMPEEVTKL